MRPHSEKGPSSADRWIHCTPSAKLCAEIPEQGSSFTQEGTDAHALCEFLVKQAVGIPMEDPTEDLSYYTSEMQECAEGYRDYVVGLVEQARQKTKDVVVMVEQRVQYERFVKDGFGTADCLIIADGTMNVVDFKFGLGVEVSAVGNPQMRIYALGALEVFDDLYDIDTVQMTIYQPRRANISIDSISRDDLYDWAENVLRPAAAEADAGNGEFHTGKWCRFCKVKHICRERAKKNLELAAYEFSPPPLLNDSEVVDVLSKVDNLVSWANDVKEYALQEAVAGKEWPGYKLVEGRSVRKYRNEKEAAEAVLAAGFDPYTQKLLTVTEMQKMLGKKKFEEILSSVIVKPPGKPVLVSEDDKRPPMNDAKNDFTD